MSNIQIEMISVCGVDGSLTPLRFRLENEEHQLCTVAIRQVVYSNRIQYAGVDAIQYLCKAEVQGREKLFELRYAFRSHSWCLFRVVY